MQRTNSVGSILAAVVCGAASLGFGRAVGVAQEPAAPPTETMPFSAHAKALPFPPDARGVEFDATFDGVEFTSRSSLAALADLYRREMTRRGWDEDAAAMVFEDDSVEMKFTRGDAVVELELDDGSDGEVDVDMSCEELDFTGTNDPAAMVAAGVPQPRSYLYLQRAIPLPADVRDLAYGDDECQFKTPMELQAAFDHFGAAIKKLGFKESRKPIVTGDRRYTEFRNGTIELSLNIFTHDVGTRLHIGYEDERQEPVVAALPEPAGSLARTGAGTATGNAADAAEEPPGGTPIDVASNKGEAVVTQGSTTHTFRYLAAYQSDAYEQAPVTLFFADRPIPHQKMQAMIAAEGDVSISDLFDPDFPKYLSVQLGEYVSFSFSAGGVGIGDSVEEPEQNVTIADGRVRMTLKTPPEEHFDEVFKFTATADAGIMTRQTRVANFTDPPPKAPVGTAKSPMPPGARDIFSQGTKYRDDTHAKVDMPLAAVAKFYQTAFAAPEWKEDEAARIWEVDNAAKPRFRLVFTKTDESATVDASGSGAGVELVVATRDDAKARRDGMLPEPGKGRLVLGNGHTEAAVISIGKQNYPLKPGQGAQDPKGALNYTVAPAKYPLVIKVAGGQPQSEEVQIDAETTWGVIVIDAEGAMVMQLY